MLTTWDILTGKQLQEVSIKIKGTDYNNYEIFQCLKIDNVYLKPWYQKVLLKEKDPIPNINEDTFFDPNFIETHIDKQVSFVRKVQKQFNLLKLIEIVDENKVIEHFNFVHPIYKNAVQFLYFSENLDLMYEQLVVFRFFLYKKQVDPQS